MQSALAAESLQNNCFQTVIVAGTNGKGTVASLLAAILQAHGHRVGLYTSPHLIDVQERFRVNGRPLAQERIEPVMGRVLDQYGRKEQRAGGLTFFELTTLVAAILFKEESVDIAILEVGLGGRLDAVNAMEPDLSVITTIGIDHTKYLGDTIEEIAVEKTGILREGIPAIIGEQEEPGAREALLDAAKTLGSSPVISIEDGQGLRAPLERHKQTAAKAAEIVLGSDLETGRTEEGVNRWRWPGRLEELSWGEGRRILVDAAHNPAGVDALLDQVKGQKGRFDGIVWAMMKDKDPGQVQELMEHLGAPVWGGLVANERARTAAELRRVVPHRLWRGSGSTADVMDSAAQNGVQELLVFGSIFLIGEVYEVLGVKADELVTYRH